MSFDVLPHELLFLILKTAPGVPHLRLVCWRWREGWLEASKGQVDAWVADWRVTVASIPLAQLYIDLMPCKAWLCPAAAAAGRLDVLQWARAQGCPWTSSTCAYAAAEGHLEILDWAITNKCPLDLTVGRAAARQGRLEVLQWMRGRACTLFHRVCGQAAARGGFFEMVVWIVDDAPRKSYFPILNKVALGAARGGHLTILQWVAARSDKWQNVCICIEAAREGHLAVLQWAYERRCGLDMQVCQVALRAGHAEAFRWIFSIVGRHQAGWNCVSWDGFEPARGRLGILQWIRANRVLLGGAGQGLILDIGVAAIRDGDLETLRAATSDCGLAPEILKNLIALEGLAGLRMALALSGHELDGETVKYSTSALMQGDHEWVRWLELDASSPVKYSDSALMLGNRAMVRWLAGKCRINEENYLRILFVEWIGWPDVIILGAGTARRQQLLGMLGWWARHSPCLWSADLCATIAGRGDLELLQWARMQGFPWDERVCEAATLHGHQDILEWAHASGCPCTHTRTHDCRPQ
jgi:hypothetical protein